MLRPLFHLAVTVHHLYNVYVLLRLEFAHIDNEVLRTFGKMRSSYLTGWNFGIQSTYFFLILCEDIINLKYQHSPLAKLAQNKSLRHFKNLVFTSIIFPVTCLVSSVFWTLFLYDRALIYPVDIDIIIPLSRNHAIHTATFLVALAEMWLVYRPYPKRWRCFATTIFFSFCYGICLLVTYSKHELWPYPMLGLCSWPMKIVLFFFLLSLTIGFYFLGEKLNTLIWGDVKRPITNGTTLKKVS